MKVIYSKLGLIIAFLIFNSVTSFAFYNDYFVANKGQWNGDFRYHAKGNGYNLLVTDKSLNFDYYVLEQQNEQIIKHGHLVKINLRNAFLNSSILEEPSPWKLNFFFGKNPNKWVTDVQGFKMIRFFDVYPNIDLVLKHEGESPRYDFVIKPGGNPADIILQFNGVYSVSTDGENIKFYTRFGEVVNTNLFAFQKENESITQVPCRFIQKGDAEFSFEIGDYDKSKELVIDPIVMLSYFGGSNEDRIVTLKEISTGILIAAGWTSSNNFPTTEGAYDNTFNDIKDAFVCKFDLRGARRNLIYGTFFGGGGNDYIAGLSIDEVGNVYLGGTTNSSDFPVVNPFNNSLNGLYDAFITKFNSDLKTIVYSTYAGGNRDDIVTSAQLGPDKGFYVCGYTESTNLPATGGAIQTKIKGRKDLFIFKLSSSGQLVDYCTYIGGGDDDIPYSMAVSEAGNIFITGTTKSQDFPIAPYRTQQVGWQTVVTEAPYDRTFNGGWDAFAVKLLGDGGKLDFSTFFGGTADDIGISCTYTSDQKIIFTGITYKETTNPSFPVSQNAYQNTHRGGVEIFVAGLSNIITSQGGYGLTYKRQDLDFSTYLGGSSNDYPTGMLLLGKFLHIFGYTNSTNFPIVNNPTGKKIGRYDIFYAQMVSDGSGINFSDIYGTVDDDSSSAFFLTPVGDFYLAGLTNSKNLTTIHPISGTGYQGTNNIILLKNSNIDLRFENPIGKERICPNSILNIKWNSETLPATETFDIDIKLGASGSWEPLAQNIKGLNYSWNIPPTFYADSVWLRVSHPRGIIAVLGNPFLIYELPTMLEAKSTPSNPIVCEGDSVILYMKARGSGIRYQWLYNGSPISGATDSELIVRNIDASKKGQYKGIASGPCPATAETQVFNIDFIPSTKIIAQTNDTTVKKFGRLALYVYATGDKLGYQWYKDDERLIGANQNVFEIQSVSKPDEGVYKCKVTGTCGELFTQPIKVSVDTVIVSVNNFDNYSPKFFFIAPNQVVFEFNLENAQISSLNIYNTFGQSIIHSQYSRQVFEKGILVDFESLPSGIYLVEVKENERIYRFAVPVVK